MGFLAPKPATSTQQSTSTSENTNNALLTGDYSGQVAAGTGANANESALLTGKGDTAGANAGYQNYLQQAGYQPALTALSQNITGQGAASGLLNSGSTTKALANYGGQLNNQFYNNYLQNLGSLSSQGTQAGGIIAGAGQKSQSNSSGGSNGGGPSTFGNIASAVGGIASIFSDRRMKQDIELRRRDPDGLGWYNFRYTDTPHVQSFGVMADEVAELRPHALGPVINGFATVNYGDL